jgi:hypothetical protein
MVNRKQGKRKGKETRTTPATYLPQLGPTSRYNVSEESIKRLIH